MNRIVVTGGSSKTRQIIVKTLSLITSYTIIRPSSFASISIKYGINKNLNESNFDEYFLYVLSSYTERLEAEQYLDKYISDGFILYEPCRMEAYSMRSTVSSRRKREMLSMCKSLTRIAAEYAAKKYSLVIHIKENNFESADTDKIIESYIFKYNIPCIIYNKSDILELISNALDKTNIKPCISAKNALSAVLKNI